MNEKINIKKQFFSHPYLFLFIACFAAFLVFGNYNYYHMKISALIVAVSGIAFCGVYFLYYAIKKQLTYNKVILLLFIISFTIRLTYIFFINIQNVQHDMTGNYGHLAYIEYLYNNHKVIDADVRTKWQFYHPPFYYVVQAVWLKIQTLLGYNYNVALENLQFTTLFISLSTTITSYKIFKSLNFKKMPLLVATAIMCIHPYFIYLGGSINNDCLSVFFAISSIYFTIKWNENRTIKNIFLIALSVGLGMMTKLSVVLVVPAISFIFLYHLIKDKEMFKKYCSQFSLFGVISLPLGLFWSLRNYVKYKVPINYIPMFGKGNTFYVGDKTIFQRLFSLDSLQFKYILNQLSGYENSSGQNEYNIFISLLKTAAFDDIKESNLDGLLFLAKPIFFILSAVAIFAVFAMIFVLISKNTNSMLTSICCV